jgi:hypothetical protein
VCTPFALHNVAYNYYRQHSRPPVADAGFEVAGGGGSGDLHACVCENFLETTPILPSYTHSEVHCLLNQQGLGWPTHFIAAVQLLVKDS